MKNHKRFGNLVILMLWLALILTTLFYRDSITVAKLTAYIPKHSYIAAVLMLLLFAIKGMSVVIYAGILYAVNGVLFSLPTAICLNVLGTAVMAAVPYFVGSHTGSGLTDRLKYKYPKLKAVARVRKSSDFFYVLLLRLNKTLPYDVISAYLGAEHLNWKAYLTGSIIGMFPAVITFSIMGASIDHSRPVLLYLSIGIEAAITVVSLLLFSARRN